ncbi:hypothetical protein D6827_03215, partial [Candidatus Parcubacteria bacterium]
MRIYGIPVNGLLTGKKTGVENYALFLLKEMMRSPLLSDEQVILYASREVEELNPLPAGWHWRLLPWRGKGWTHLRLARELALHRPDVLFVPMHEVPIFTGFKTVATVHDIAFYFYPKTYSLRERLRQELSLWRIVKTADRIIAVSENTANDLKKVYGVPSDMIVVVYHGINNSGRHDNKFDISAIRKKYHLP